DSECPSGYNCGGVVLLTQDQCTQDTECGGGGRQCVVGEGELRGFCTCVSDQDCAFEAAPPSCQGSCGGIGLQPCTMDSECLTTCVFQCQSPQGRACTVDSDYCLCQAGTCINTGRQCTSGAECNPPCVGGGCSLGAACAPSEGLLCTDVR
ncbi:unnamed protein product, partial [Laminaria digitata]